MLFTGTIEHNAITTENSVPTGNAITTESYVTTGNAITTGKTATTANAVTIYPGVNSAVLFIGRPALRNESAGLKFCTKLHI